jgi:toluene monooxygenase system protein B
MAPLPITATFSGDIVTLAVLVDDADTAAQVADKIAVHVAGKRVADRAAPVRLRVAGQVIEPNEVFGTMTRRPLTHVEAFFDE